MRWVPRSLLRRSTRKPAHWTQTLFVKHAELFLPWMREMRSLAPAQAEGLQKIFEKHGVNPGARVLDLQSGIGRISIHLAKIGYEVVGTDISPLYLEEAEKWAAKEKLEDKVRFYRLDSREAARKLRKNEKHFDSVINVGTAMGYYGEDVDLRTFADIRKVCGPRALLVIETVNRDYLVKNFQPVNISTLDGIEWHEIRKLNFETSTMENVSKYFKKKGTSLRLAADIHVSHRVYSIHELKKLVESAGWKYLESYGSLRGLVPLASDSIHMTLVAHNN